jgi:hypothetical protein
MVVILARRKCKFKSKAMLSSLVIRLVVAPTICFVSLVFNVLFCLMQVYYIEDIMSVYVVMIEGKCDVTAKHDLPNSDFLVVVEHAFYCEHLYDLDTGVHISRLDICLNSAFDLPGYL